MGAAVTTASHAGVGVAMGDSWALGPEAAAAAAAALAWALTNRGGDAPAGEQHAPHTDAMGIGDSMGRPSDMLRNPSTPISAPRQRTCSRTHSTDSTQYLGKVGSGQFPHAQRMVGTHGTEPTCSGVGWRAPGRVHHGTSPGPGQTQRQRGTGPTAPFRNDVQLVRAVLRAKGGESGVGREGGVGGGW